MGTAFRVAQAALAVLATVPVPSVYAQSSAREDARSIFRNISGYSLEGRMLLKSEDFTRLVAPFIGQKKSTADIERARDALQQAYNEVGHCSIRVTMVSPEPLDGVVTFRASEIPAGDIRESPPMVGQPPIPVPVSQSQAAPGVTVAPYVEGGGGRGLTFTDHGSARSVMPLVGTGQTPPQIASATEPKSASSGAGVILAQAGPAKPADPATPPPADIVPVAPVAAPKFEIQRYVVEGNTLLTREKVDQVLRPYSGKDKDFGDVQRALEALQGAYQEAGYGGVEIRLPEQELERGEVKFVVIETKIGRITVEGNEHFTRENIRRSVPSLREGVTPNSREIAESIKLANENPSKQATVLLRGAEREGEVDATIRVADIDPRRWSVSLDNTGNTNTGRARVGLAYQHSNLFDRDHVLTAQYITSVTKFKDVSVYGVGYKIPLYSLGDSIEFVGGYSNVDSGTVQDLFLVSGQGAIYGVRYNQALPKWREVEHKLTYGLDYRAYQNQVTPEGAQDNLVPDVTVHPISLTYSASLRVTGHDLSIFLNATQNIRGGNDGQEEDFKQLGTRHLVGTSNYNVFRGGFNYVRALKDDWQFRTNFSAQYTNDALIAPEQFGIGGADSVRGFNERYLSNDKGYKTTVEIYTPDVAKALGLGEGRLRFLAFYDTGALRRNFAGGGENKGGSLDSGGVGLRLSHKSYFTMRLDVAHVFHDGSGFSEPDNRRNIKKFHFSAAWVW